MYKLSSENLRQIWADFVAGTKKPIEYQGFIESYGRCGRDCPVHQLSDRDGPFAPQVARANPGKNAAIAVFDLF
jgi:hypothetical protein